MRHETQIFDIILSVAKNDDRIRAVILNGSRVNNSIKKDEFQDFDIIYLVERLNTFKSNPNWIDIFGDRIILQLPNSMNLNGNSVELNDDEICYLMLFKDFNRIDLTLTKVKNRFTKKDSLTQVLLDKDNLCGKTLPPNDKDYWTKKPTQKEFSDCCNEFWWVSTYIVKALARNEIINAKEIHENIVRQMFMKVIAWNVAAKYNFEINLGKNNRFLKNYSDPDIMTQILKTYPDASKINIWNSLILMADIFHKKSIELAHKLALNYNYDEADNVQSYIRLYSKMVSS